MAQGVAVLKPGEEPDQEVGEEKAFIRALAELFPRVTPDIVQQSDAEIRNEICRFWEDRKKWITKQKGEAADEGQFTWPELEQFLALDPDCSCIAHRFVRAVFRDSKNSPRGSFPLRNCTRSLSP